MQRLKDIDWLPVLSFGVTIALCVVALYVAHLLLERRARKKPRLRFRNQLIMVGLSLTALLIVLLALPIEDRRQEALGVIGILLSATVALSSTTIVGNAMAGVMMRAVRSFRTGDFIRIGEHFGGVTERGLFHVEIQNEDGELTTLPNLFMVTHPVTKMPESGTFVSATVSLGYDIPRTRIEPLLLDAAQSCGLQDGFVQVRELGDYSVSYRVAGKLTEIKQVLTIRSRLRCMVLDSLHRGGVEIVSPSFMNQRVFATTDRFVPDTTPSESEIFTTSASIPEDAIFNKVNEAKSLEGLRDGLERLIEEIGKLEQRIGETDEGDEKRQLERTLATLQGRKKLVEDGIERREKDSASSKD